MNKIIIKTGPVWSNLIFILPIFLPLPRGAYIAAIGLTLSSGLFHYYQYHWGKPTVGWQTTVGYFWQKADVIFIYITFIMLLTFPLRQYYDGPLDLMTIGFIVAIGLGAVENRFTVDVIGVLVILAAITSLVVVPTITMLVIVGLFGVAVYLRKEAYVDPFLHTVWHLICGCLIYIWYYQILHHL